jgi:hypothetical protein
MKTIIKFLVLMIIFAYSCNLDECSSKSSFISSYDDFIKEVSKSYQDYTEEDWNKANERYKKLTGECYEKFEKDFTSDEERKIFKNSLKYNFYRISSELPVDLKSEKTKKFTHEVEQLFDKEKDLNKALEKIKEDDDFKKAGDELRKSLKHFEKGMQDLGKELNKIFNEKEEK